jgi:hypothetical protein
MLEFTLVIGVLLMVTLGVVEFSYAFYQWNAASKAVQLGARLAAVSDPVDSTLLDITGLEGGLIPGVPLPSPPNPPYFDRECSGATQQCTAVVGDPGPPPDYDAAAMDILVNGRDNDYQTTEPQGLPGMRTIFWRIRPQNVVVRYAHTGLGFAGRPGGPVPTITVELVDLEFEFIFLGGLMGFGPIQIPAMHTTVTGEDLSILAP